jgi:hypothetical protein
MEGDIGPGCQNTVGPDGLRRRGSLHGNYHRGKIKVPENRQFPFRRFRQGFRPIQTFIHPAAEILGEAPPVDPYSDGDLLFRGPAENRLNAIPAADVAGIDPYFRYGEIKAPEGDFVIKVNVRHQRHGDCRGQAAQNFGVLHAGNGKTEKAAAHILEPLYPFNKSPVRFPFRIGKRKAILPHGLNDHGMIAPNQDGRDMIKAADLYDAFFRYDVLASKVTGSG